MTVLPKPFDDNKRYYFSYEHSAERLMERYRLFLTPEVWDQWHDALRTGTDAIYICKTVDAEVWRVKFPSSPTSKVVFIAVRDGIIRTVLPTSGWHIPAARVAAKAIGETSLGIKLPPTQPKPVNPAPTKQAGPGPDFRLADIETRVQYVKKKYEIKLENMRQSDLQTKSQAQLFVVASKKILGKEKFIEIWDAARAMFPDDPAWN